MNSLGIIGGADGPTAIFISGDPTLLIAICAVIVAVVAVAAMFIVKKIKKK